MRIRCSNVGRCTTIIDFKKGHVQIGDHLFCGRDCALQWQEQSRILQHAAEGAPMYGRRPGKSKTSWDRDG